MRRIVLIRLIAVAALLGGCAQTPAEREAALEAWRQRDLVRAAECLRNGGQWVADTCVYGGGQGL